MNDELEKLREIYLADDLDEEDRKDNEQRIKEWAKALRENTDMAAWQSHDVTKRIIKGAKDSYKELAMQLATNRSLTDTERASIWAKQDAMKWLLDLVETNAKESLEQIHGDIKAAIARDVH